MVLGREPQVAGQLRPVGEQTLDRGRERLGVGLGEDVFVGGVMQHIEDAGIHSGDSACVVPPYLLRDEHVETMKQHTIIGANMLDRAGLNIQGLPTL